MFSYNEFGHNIVDINTQTHPPIENIKPFADQVGASYKKPVVKKEELVICNEDYFFALVERTENAKKERNTSKYKNELCNRLALTVERLGVFIRQEDILELSLGEGRLIKVGGLMDLRRSQRLEEELNKTKTKNGEDIVRNIHAVAFYMETEYARSAANAKDAIRRANLIELKDVAAELVKEKTDVEMDFARLTLTPDGNVTGYPGALRWVFEEIQGKKPATDEEREKVEIAAAVRLAALLIAQEGYEEIPLAGDVEKTLYFTKDDFTNIDLKI